MRIGGLASGIDTESIIRDMMKAHRLPLDKITQKKQYTQWQLDDYRSTNRDLRKSSDKLFDTVMKQSTYMKKNVSVSDEKAVSITAKGSTSDFSGTIEVKQLATQATLQSGVLKGGGTDKIKEEDIQNKSLKKLGLFTGDQDQSLTIKVPGDDNATSLTIKSSDKLSDVLKQINEKTGASAFYDSATGRIAMSAKDSGKGLIEVSGETSLVENLKLNAPTPLDPDNPSALVPLLEPDGPRASYGADAKFTFNGLETTRPSNTFTINGFEVSLKQTTTSPVTFSSSTDTDKVLESVVEFVNDYNEMIEKLNSKIKEKQFKSFHPLSAEQKADMKEKEVELWEEKAMSGTLKGDPALSSMLNNLRSIMSTTVNTTDKDGKSVDKDGQPIKISLKDLGIETSKNYLDNGKLTINEDKLRAKISENPNAVYDLIGGKDNGIAQQYRKELQDAQKKITVKAGSSTAVNDTFALGRSIKNMDKQIERFETKLQMMESRYYKQFNAMEQAIQRANSQSAALMSSLGGGM
ncbi:MULTISPECIES: flagellar filament capping protein FliD [unclassified Sporosarcina]|uniref:flagellar filament capping protein FliD n=1 Tax=unclassified Sporosarcina TaxID=2647733 RepID=UPI000C16C0C2|nr:MULTISPECIES: flagellar filament capping protein FliD [unclassified Sporosarcina]PID05036.1 flagellar cap protein FliD [Sporosarcina sp. P30]PID07576.1 flagellar cap protein FliD [Sporosarcina sp. P31]PID11790.1 flagellar cap protein FliD [Sporosarcina sp. P32b]